MRVRVGAGVLYAPARKHQDQGGVQALRIQPGLPTRIQEDCRRGGTYVFL